MVTEEQAEKIISLLEDIDSRLSTLELNSLSISSIEDLLVKIKENTED